MGKRLLAAGLTILLLGSCGGGGGGVALPNPTARADSCDRGYLGRFARSPSSGASDLPLKVGSPQLAGFGGVPGRGGKVSLPVGGAPPISPWSWPGGLEKSCHPGAPDDHTDPPGSPGDLPLSRLAASSKFTPRSGPIGSNGRSPGSTNSSVPGFPHFFFFFFSCSEFCFMAFMRLIEWASLCCA